MMKRTTQDKYSEFKDAYSILHKSVVSDDYGAQSYEYKEAGQVQTMFVPVSNEATIEEFGEGGKDLLQAVIYELFVPIFPYDRIDIRGTRYEVVKVEVWMTHRLITVRRVTNGNAT